MKVQFASVFIALLGISFFSSTVEAEEPFQLWALSNGAKEEFYNESCLVCTRIENDPGIIAFSKHWKIVYVPNQSYLGRVVVSPYRHFGTYEEMSEEEAKEYRQIFQVLLPSIKKAFDVTHFNVAFLMNTAFLEETPDPVYKNGLPNPHFHWHIIPRYDSGRTFAGKQFSDPTFGQTWNLSRKQYLMGEFRKEAIASIRQNLNIQYVNDASEVVQQP